MNSGRSAQRQPTHHAEGGNCWNRGPLQAALQAALPCISCRPRGCLRGRGRSGTTITCSAASLRSPDVSTVRIISPTTIFGTGRRIQTNHRRRRRSNTSRTFGGEDIETFISSLSFPVFHRLKQQAVLPLGSSTGENGSQSTSTMHPRVPASGCRACRRRGLGRCHSRVITLLLCSAARTSTGRGSATLGYFVRTRLRAATGRIWVSSSEHSLSLCFHCLPLPFIVFSLPLRSSQRAVLPCTPMITMIEWRNP